MKRLMFVAVLVVLVLGLMACGGTTEAPEPEVVTVVETQVVEVTQLVEGEEVIVTQIVENEVEVVVTATPEPVEEVSHTSDDPSTLVNATFGGPDTFDPALNYETAGNEVLANVYETLIFYDGANAQEFVPMLATDWEISDDGLTYTFNIREGVTFHDGAEMTASDVAYSYQRAILQGGPVSPMFLFTEPFLGIGIYDIAELVDPALVGDSDGLGGADPAAVQSACETITNAIVADEDAGTVTFTLAQPWAPLLATMAGSWGAVLDQDWAMANGTWDGDCATWQNFYGVTAENNPIATITNGTGPYMLDHWTPGEEVVLTANPDYWVTEPLWEGAPTGPARIETIVIQSVDEWGTRFAMLQAGDADFAVVDVANRPQVDPLVGELCTYVDVGEVDCQATENPDAPLRLFSGLPSVVRTDAFFTFVVNTEGGNNFIGSGELDGNGIPPDFFSDINVRRGFNYCFDWEAFINDVYQGEAVQNAGILIPTILGYDPDGPKYEFDLEQCESELAQAWGGVLPETGFRLQAAYNTGNTTRQTVGEILQANLAAVNENYVVETIGLPWPNFLAQQRESRLPLFASGWAEDIHDPHNWAQPFTVGTYGGRQAFPEELLNQFGELVSAAVAETDPDARAELYAQLDQVDYDNAPAIRLVTAPGRHYEQRWVQDYYYNPAYPGFYYYALDIVGEGEGE